MYICFNWELGLNKFCSFANSCMHVLKFWASPPPSIKVCVYGNFWLMVQYWWKIIDSKLREYHCVSIHGVATSTCERLIGKEYAYHFMRLTHNRPTLIQSLYMYFFRTNHRRRQNWWTLQHPLFYGKKIKRKRKRQLMHALQFDRSDLVLKICDIWDFFFSP